MAMPRAGSGSELAAAEKTRQIYSTATITNMQHTLTLAYETELLSPTKRI